jgi:enterochelin esterase family protein
MRDDARSIAMTSAEIVDPTGRLAPIAALVNAAREGAADLEALLIERFPQLQVPPADLPRQLAFHGHRSPAGLGAGGVAVWHDLAVFAVSSTQPPQLSVDGGDGVAMTPVSGTSLWVTVQRVAPGQLHLFRYGLDGEWGPGGDFAGYQPLSYPLADAPRGAVSDRRVVSSEIYPGATTEYWLYVSHGVDEQRGAPLMVWHDGGGLLEPGDLGGLRMQVVTDNLVHLGSIPPMVHVLVNPSTGGEGSPMTFGQRYATSMRGVQYDTVSDRYGRHIAEEVLPDAEQAVKLRDDAYSRGAAGGSSGGLSAFKLGWYQPDQFSRVHSIIGSFTGIQWYPERDLIGGFMVPHMVRREPKRNLRVWFSEGMNDLELNNIEDQEGPREVFEAGSWPLCNIMLANALKGRGYDFHFRYGEGYHDGGQGALDLPESLAWLWRGYDPERTEQVFEQETSERQQPVFRVRIANRDAW